MSKLWQLKKISTNETLSEPQLLPENWGPIFGLPGIQDQLGDLSWLGDNYKDMGWFVVGDAPPGPLESTVGQIVWERAKKLLSESDWSMLPDVIMTSSKKSEWIEYRRLLREIKSQTGFPNEVEWPKIPE